MSKEVTFMRADLFSEQEMEKAVEFLSSLFLEDGKEFKKMLKTGSAYIEGKSFTYIRHEELGKIYQLMGNCIGPVIYVRDILPLKD